MTTHQITVSNIRTNIDIKRYELRDIELEISALQSKAAKLQGQINDLFFMALDSDTGTRVAALIGGAQ